MIISMVDGLLACSVVRCASSSLCERRRRLMDDWAEYLSGTHEDVWHGDGNLASRP